MSGSAGSTTAKPVQHEPGQSAARRALHAYRGLPLAFVPNAGQVDRRARYAAHAGSTSVFLTRREVVVVLAQGRHAVALRLAFVRANPRPTIVGARQIPGRINYFVGNDAARWHTNLPSYAQIVYRDLWPGVELRVRGGSGALKYEFRLAPGADPARIRLAYRGQERLSLLPGGALQLDTAFGALRDARPVSYQVIGERRIAVESRFVLGDDGAYGFALGRHDPRYPLVLDPGLFYSTFLGGGTVDNGYGITVDSAGSAYVTGVTFGADYPTTAGVFDSSLGGTQDAFVTKLSPPGSAATYSTFLGGSGSDRGGAIAVDAAGSAYLAGTTSSADFPTTPGAFDRTYGGEGDDAFVTKLNADGSALVYSTYLGGTGLGDWGQAIAVDGSGDAFVTGRAGRDFPTTAGAFDTTYNGSYEAFVTKVDPRGSALGYSSYLGGASNEVGYGIAVDGAGGAYVAGETYSTGYPTTAGAFDRTLNGHDDGFVTKLNAAGSALAYSTFLGGTSYDLASAVALDGAGSSYLSGRTGSADFPTTAGAFDTASNADDLDAFVTKLNAAGSALAYSTFLGGTGIDSGKAVAVDGSGSAYVAGQTDVANFPVSPAGFDTSFNGVSDAFAARLNAAGSALVYSTYVGGGDRDFASALAVDGAGNAYITGSTNSTDFPVTTGAFDAGFNGLTDAFLTKLDLPIGSPAPPPPPPPPPPPRPLRCRVPRVIGMKLPNAKRKIKARHCSVGRLRRVHVRARLAGRIVGQNPRAGTVRARGFRIRLVLGRRR